VTFSTIDPLSPLFVVEGEIDCLTISQAGFKCASLPSASYKPTAEEKDKILEAETVILAGDSDIPGQEAMNRLWKDFSERTFLLHWPGDFKDANDYFVRFCKKDIPTFRKELRKLMAQAKSSPMPHITSLQESLANSNRTNLADHPNRLRFPWPTVDKMAILLPGSVMTVSATNTKMGKTNFIKDVSLHNAFHGDIVLNYQCELTNEEFGTMVAAGLLKKNRNHLTKEDLKEASERLVGVRYYIGRNPTLTTVEPVLDLIEDGIRRLGATIVVLDHLHFICRNSDNEIRTQADAMQRVKNMSVSYGVKFIVVSQPRKARQDSRGKLLHVTDVKGSETITSDADAIFCIHREFIKTKDPDNPPMDDYDPRMEIHLLGARAKGDGPTYAELMFQGEYGSIFEGIKVPEGF
jgi:DnaB-like helicase C terminal domain/Toprim-like